ncbi:MAG: DapH/DapD/GlmU-related protein [Desulfurococcales archaeon]|jgi:acetyltransferase-like isoleucine patch superfamily enzyme|nr:DapH/DapD/GlmU-related protein [Desulfurococcales archaeon]
MISRRASIGKVAIDPTALVYGGSVIEDGCYIGSYSIIGYPSRDTLRSLLEKAFMKTTDMLDPGNDHAIYDVGNGSRIGSGSIIRSHVIIYERTFLGKRVRVGHHVLIREDTTIGDDTLIGSNSIIDGGVEIGNKVQIQSGVYIPPKVSIEDNVFIGPRAVFTNDKYPPSRRLVRTSVGEGAVIGANSTIIAGIRIGRRSVVAAGSVVTKDVPDEVVVVGNPARVVMSRDEYEDKKRRYELLDH